MDEQNNSSQNVADSIKNALGRWGIQIPLVLYVFGFFVHSMYLSRYSVQEFDILQSRYIYSGISTLLFFAIVLVLILLRTDVSQFGNNFRPLNFFSWLVRLPAITLLLFFCLNNPYLLMTGYTADKFGVDTARSLVNFLILFSFFYYGGLLFVSFGHTTEEDNRVFRLVKITMAFLSIPLCLLIYYLSDYYKPLSDIFYFNLVLFFLVSQSFAVLRDQQKGLSSTSEALRNAQGNFPKKVLLFIYGILLAVSFLGLLALYSRNMYPLIPHNLGGAKPIPVGLILKTETINTRLINESSSWLITQETNTSNVVKIKSSDVDRIIVKVR